MSEDVDIAIIGAGPYGLSIGAHLRERGANFRIFGIPMGTWRTQMPKGMFLKSEGFASDLFDPARSFPLSAYCAEQDIGYADVGLPVALQTFSDYGLAFQRRFVPELTPSWVANLERSAGGFTVTLASGERVNARRVVVAVGITHFAHIPPLLAGLPSGLVSHSSRHHSLDGFRGSDVAVIGAGSSAVDVAALLHEAGAFPQLITRRYALEFQNPPEQEARPLWQRVRAPRSGLGTGWRSRLCTDMPIVFRRLPTKMRHDIVRTHLGPAPCWFTKDKIVGKVPTHLGLKLDAAKPAGNKVRLDLVAADGGKRSFEADHIIAGTGYRVSLQRVPFLGGELRAKISTVEDTPVLSNNFESTIPGLFFVGAAAANCFGPLLRFAYGAGFTANRLARHLHRGRASKRRVRAAGEGPFVAALESR